MPSASLEGRIASLEGSYRELTKRSDDLRSEITDLRTEMRAGFRWVFTLILVNWLSILAAIFLVVAKR